VHNPLLFDGKTYTMNFKELEDIFKEQHIKLFILCSPHNPVGRVWKEEELITLGNLCVKYKVILISDEIHGDLILKGNRHVPFASLSEDFRDLSITCTAPSKTFNLASLQTSNIIIPNADLREKFLKSQEIFSLGLPNVFGMVAAESAYRYGEAWLEELLVYIQGNLDYMKSFLNETIPEIKVIQPEGTYLCWLDMNALNLDEKKQEETMLKIAKVAFDEGYIFGPGGKGFTRINLACPRSVLAEGLNRLNKAVTKIKN
jgi:cystathionine beta-lyase